ncbi:MAG: DNA mismatch repair endonuclease MutL [Clostridia bacterium]|nr:DNA mismatch repair endonuclease MutL [Clostridia bacterium]
MPIRVLDAETIGRIAAGEVVERPASIAKELIENSLDAGATSVTIEIRDGGTSYLRVTDNGCGIPPEEARIAFENHATSKISSGDELTDILTLGFRGEALPSISAVSRVTMTTRQRGADSGIRVRVEGGVVQDVSAAGCPEGTSIVVQDLFFNTPVRRTFLKKPATEGGVVADMVARLILGNPGVSIRLINNGKNVYHSFGDGDMRHAALAVYGREIAEKLKYMDETEGSFRVSGLIGIGDLARSNRSHQFFFINGRVVRSPLMTQALESATRSLVTIGQHPVCALSLKMPPHTVDINVHPSKLEVRFRDEASVRIYIESMLSRALLTGKMLDPEQITAEPVRIQEKAPVRYEIPVTISRPVDSAETHIATPEKECAEVNKSITSSPVDAVKKAVDISTSHPDTTRQETPQKADTAGLSARIIEHAVPEQRAVPSIPPVNKQSISEQTAVVVDKEMTDSDDGPLEPIIIPDMTKKRSLHDALPSILTDENTDFAPKSVHTQPNFIKQTDIFSEKSSAIREEIKSVRIIGVFSNTYILAECDETLLMIDQHAAHERINYLAYERALHQGNASQQLLTPIILSMSHRERDSLLANQELLEQAGYEIEPFGDRDIQVRAVPHVLGQSELRPLFLEMIDRLDQLKNATIDRRRAEVIQASCKRAVKAGDRLSEAEIRALVDEMLRTDAPPTCPHGRPVIKAFKKNEIERMFKRI